MMTPRFRFLLPLFSILLILGTGCPHRSPVWSPDGRMLLLLAGADGEELDKPASKLYLIPCTAAGAIDGKSSTALEVPGATGDIRFMAVVWLDSSSFIALTVEWEDDEVVEDSERIWHVTENGTSWRKIEAPRPSSEWTMRRNPVVTRAISGKPTGVAYIDAEDRLTVIDPGSSKVMLQLEEAQLSGPGPDGGFLAYISDNATGGLKLIAHGNDMKRRWERQFSGIATEIATILGKKRGTIVFNDTSTAIPAADGQSIGVNLVFTDVSWNDGVQGYHAILAAADGAVLGVTDGVCFPGRPATTIDRGSGQRWAWGVFPTTRRSIKTGSIRSRLLHTTAGMKAGTKAAAGADLVLGEYAKSALHGYALSPNRMQLVIVINGPRTRLLSFPVARGKLTGKPVEVTLD